MKSKLALLLILANVSVAAIWAQSPSASTSANESRAGAMLKQLSLEQKIDLIGGETISIIREIKPLVYPRFKMADGPFGVRNYGPSTTFPAASVWRRRGIRIWPGAWVRSSARMHAPAASTSCLARE